ncbi:MAG: hypothetical protein ACR2QM_18265 [Longimicrobiales bacterium]
MPSLSPVPRTAAIVALVTCAGCGQVGQAEVPTSAEGLAAEFKNGALAKDRARLNALVSWDAVTDEMRTSQEQSLGRITEYDVADVTVDPLPGDYQARRVRNGLVYRPNVEVEGMLTITFGASGPPSMGSMSMPFGRTGEGNYLVAGITTEPMSSESEGESMEDVSLNVSVVGAGNTEPIQFEGRCVFVASGEELIEPFQGSGNLSKAFWGQYVKRCSVRRTAGAGWLQMRVSEGGERVFTSERDEAADSIVYEAPVGRN